MFADDRELTRRRFLGANIRTAACLSVAGSIVSADALGAPAKKKNKGTRRKKKIGKMQFGLTTYQLAKEWDIPTIIANCTKADALGVELRTSMHYAHGVELTLTDNQRAEVKKQFNDSPVKLVGLASSERFHWPEPEKLKAAIEAAKQYMKLSYDVGGSGVRVFGNDFVEGVPHETTIAQIAKALNEVGAYAADYNQKVRLEAHGSVGTLPTIAQIMKQVDQPNVRVKLNSSIRDNEGDGLLKNIRLVRKYLDDTLHVHSMKDSEFPHQLQMDILMRMGWNGWWLLEVGNKEPDLLQELIAQKKLWDGFYKTSLEKMQKRAKQA